MLLFCIKLETETNKKKISAGFKVAKTHKKCLFTKLQNVSEPATKNLLND